MSAREDPVLYVLDGAVAVITLNRPERLNAWTVGMERRYLELLDRAGADPAVRAVVVTGAGRGYSGGTDIGALGTVGEAGTRPLEELLSPVVPRTYAFPKPLIAAVNGSCAGFALAQALACDLRFAAAGAKLTTSYSRRGLVAEDGTSWLLPRIVGLPRALDLLLSGRVVLAEEAREMGLVDRVVATERVLDEALAYAGDLAENCSPAAMASIKAQVRRHLGTDLPTALEESARLVQESLGHPDFREGVASFRERRPPMFAPLDPPA
jgi:enoyl-CoA hydratase/carnithine racemase